MSQTIRIGILGAGGFTGQRLLSLLSRHPQASVEYITSSEYAGKNLASALPFLTHPSYQNLKFQSHPESIKDFPKLDLVFMATPDEVSLRWGGELIQNDYRVIDIAGAFRLKDAQEFQKYYKLEHSDPQTLAESVYGMPFLNREKIRNARLVANPGCYPTAALYGLKPVSDLKLPGISTLYLDGKSGTSGAGGRKEKDSLGFSTVYENFRAYRVEGHQHQPEMRQGFAWLSDRDDLRIRFTPHLIPMFQGIFMTAYIPLDAEPGFRFSELEKAASSFAERENFVRYYSNPNEIETRHVHNTNYADIAYQYDEENKVLIAFSAIDNLYKGAAGIAIENMNIMFGFDEAIALL